MGLVEENRLHKAHYKLDFTIRAEACQVNLAA